MNVFFFLEKKAFVYSTWLLSEFFFDTGNEKRKKKAVNARIKKRDSASE